MIMGNTNTPQTANIVLFLFSFVFVFVFVVVVVAYHTFYTKNLTQRTLHHLVHKTEMPSDREKTYLDAILERDLEGIDVNLADDTHTLLTLAVHLGKNDIVEFLVERGADPYLKDALEHAARVNNLGAAEILLKHCNILKWKLTSALRIAIQEAHVEMMKRLLLAGADVLEDHVRSIFKCHRSDSTKLYSLLEILIENGADLNDLHSFRGISGGNSYTALMIAITCDMDPVVIGEFLINHDVDVHTRDRHGENALFHAVNNNSRRWVLFLINHGIDINCVTGYSWRGGGRKTPIFKAEDIDMARFLLENGAHLNHKQGDYFAMGIAFHHNGTTVMEWLNLFETLGPPSPEFVCPGDGIKLFQEANIVPCVDKLLQMSRGHLTPYKILNTCLLFKCHRIHHRTSSSRVDILYHKPGFLDNLHRLLPRIAVDKVLVTNAIKAHEIEIARELLDNANPPINLSNVDFQDFATWAISRGDLGSLRFLASLGNTINYQEKDATGPLYDACIDQNHVENLDMIRFLLENGAHDLNTCLEKYGWRLKRNWYDVLKEYNVQLRHRLRNPNVATLNEIPSTGHHTLLHLAVLQGSLADVRLLVHLGACIHVKTSYGLTALDLSRRYKRGGMITYLEKMEHLEMVAFYEVMGQKRRKYEDCTTDSVSSMITIPDNVFHCIREFNLPQWL
jgi:ankyrin repeat protein